MKRGIPLLALGMLLGDCGAAPRQQPERFAETVPARCDVGGKPGYFVPSSSPPVVLGCARLGVSGKRVEFSCDRARIDGEAHVCLNPAYGRRGRYIPAICKLDPPPSRFAIRDAMQPRQGVRGYAFVIWGTAPAGTATVVARSGSAIARAAVFDVPPSVTGPSFAVFVLELRSRPHAMTSPPSQRERTPSNGSLDATRCAPGPSRAPRPQVVAPGSIEARTRWIIRRKRARRD